MSLTHQYKQNNGPVVICDTDVWYKNVPTEVKENFILAATWLSVYELFKASDRRPGVIINTWQKLRDNSRYIILLSPEQYFHFHITGGEVVHTEIFEERKATAGLYDLMLEKKKNYTLTNEQWKQFETQAKAIRTDYNERFGRWVTQIDSFRRDNPKTDEKDSFLNDPKGIEGYLHHVTMPLILMLLTGIKYEDIEGKELETDSILKFELFTRVFNQWIIDLDLGEDTATVNDLIDVLNMIFVTPIDKYWTHETKWISKINKVGMSHYLFNPTL